MLAILAIAQKDLRILFRLRSGIFFTFLWPLLVAILFGVMFSGPGEQAAKTRIAVVDEDNTAASRDFIAHLEKGGAFDILRTGREDAALLVRQGKQTAAVVFFRGFGQASQRVFYGEPPKVELWIDPSRKAESAMLEGLLFKQAAEGMQKILSDPSASGDAVQKALKDLKGVPESSETASVGQFLGDLSRFLETRRSVRGGTAQANWQPLAIESKSVTVDQTGPRNAFDITFPQGILWGIIGCVMTFGIGIVTERTQGTMVRLQMSPITRRQLLAGKALACFSAIAIVQAGLFIVGRIFFKVHPSSWWLLALAAVSAGVCFVGIMMLTAVLGKTEQAAAGAGWAIMMPLTMLGGGMIPLFLLPSWMATIGNISPMKWAILAFEGAIWRAFSLQEMLLPCGILVFAGIVCFSVGTRAFRSV
jgi:ABC-2 type transport system permease protein